MVMELMWEHNRSYTHEEKEARRRKSGCQRSPVGSSVQLERMTIAKIQPWIEKWGRHNRKAFSMVHAHLKMKGLVFKLERSETQFVLVVKISLTKEQAKGYGLVPDGFVDWLSIGCGGWGLDSAGSVLVEYGRVEACCLAAHCLHGRFFDIRMSLNDWNSRVLTTLTAIINDTGSVGDMNAKMELQLEHFTVSRILIEGDSSASPKITCHKMDHNTCANNHRISETLGNDEWTMENDTPNPNKDGEDEDGLAEPPQDEMEDYLANLDGKRDGEDEDLLSDYDFNLENLFN
ncbi:Splicing factor U2AF 50 kDa subunit [Spatholobus suberectus]|nr:Splicing factor U2AF 50 kDa subunit [Spatholobus suberectus]